MPIQPVTHGRGSINVSVLTLLSVSYRAPCWAAERVASGLRGEGFEGRAAESLGQQRGQGGSEQNPRQGGNGGREAVSHRPADLTGSGG